MSGTPAYVDLEPGLWRSLLARSTVFHAARTLLPDLSDLALQPGIVRSVIDDLVQLAGECATDEDTDDSDDAAAVRRVVAAWEAELTTKLAGRRLDVPTRTLLARLQALVGEADGTDPIRPIFLGVTRYASALYGTAWRPPSLRVSHVRSHPRGADVADDPYTLTALTKSSGPAGTSMVELIVYCQAFGPAAYAAVPIVFIHECVCHVPARQEGADNGSPFAEGFMDWASYFFLDQWATKIDAGLSSAARMHARALRALLTGRTDTATARARRLGHRGAETLVTWFESTLECGSQQAEMRVAQLAVALNQVDRPLVAKDHFVSQLCDPLPPDLDVLLREWADRPSSAAALLDLPAAA